MNDPWTSTIRTPDGVTRYLGLTPSKLYGAGVLPTVPPIASPLVPISELAPFDAWPADLPILDQGSWNACTYFSSTQALQYARHESGQPYVALDPLYTYLKVTGGRNTGTNVLQASQILSAAGVPPRSKSQSSDVTAAALRFRMELTASLASWEELLSEAARRRPIVGSVHVGRSYPHLDAEGAMGVDRGQANHAIFLGGGLRFSKTHGWMIKHAGSWGTAWGQAGFGWYTEAHFDNAAYGEAYSVAAVREDLADNDNPPEVTAA
jgi:hypothetical protein